MNLYLVRHAEAKQKYEDLGCPLSEIGWINIKKVAAFVAKHANVKVSRIIHSEKTRARQTAEILVEHLNFTGIVEHGQGLNPLAEPSIWAKKLAGIKENIMLVGHLPYLNKLAALLLCQTENKTVVEFQNAAFVCLTRDIANLWSLRWMVVPQILH